MIRHFLICPGIIRSRSDKQIHYVGPTLLMQLYGVHPDECRVLESRHYDRPERSWEEGLLYLCPNYEGDYSLPDVEADPCIQYHHQDGAQVQLALLHAMHRVLKCLP